MPLLGFVLPFFAFVVVLLENARLEDCKELAANVVISLLGFFVTLRLIPSIKDKFTEAGLFGYDINKKGLAQGDKKIPEAVGLVSATIYILCICLLHLFRQSNNVELYTAAFASVTFMVLLGFADDVLNLKWRYKLILPLVASLPLLVLYTGGTCVLVPRPLRFLTKGRSLVELGILYYIYMALLSVFCTNAINIYAGINGLEVGQSVIIALAVLLHNALQLHPGGNKDNLDLLRQNHLFSIDLILPFYATSLALAYYNWYPSKVFVGDTFCYFAGMTFAMAAILAHFSEILLLFFIPQLINFIYSIPQLIGIVHCPRHRLPRLNGQTGKLEAIRTNLNLVNLTLWILGPLTERQLCIVLCSFQAFCCAMGLFLRAWALHWL
ncbi:UDP-N-acetylglucosamine--dolichyl-phosphate N-acetylglucosaminephosphotransferase [Galdieria sulphuraria]|uniref:UDP-N-acetylglucosamine--dolichyl-phosphate N-acetylglucosaminephosphotransferase n=1 Tax=Galdieria sulphuraria TaxID=130081 RepID=M2X0J8_GALSU|nr:UDP-N-acetylglucosamine--dolichyl-phosphateN-acetylglucosaminephosphotransferase [Galdieria sulphuraria]EME29860.1 UDP-N-acetylglucosamine--dolichyl-phosphateN-acetylglucosaminephosphotransferase [Galdieria sulphuraria]GJD06848.1 UDP-N-acetylglucosamine--dolichyl-phosphate N-acetylglucosaminephosphotransferase [Galdieria sulphuraria]|eukprot:XP_005706380.1 UDP-N-acetylglucosamine--dolichyl-phosphateN-acetylglucosaminephosphotransferase [Galdieria sulphuraria]